jgi:tRNA threonylcarbamoyladenosine biosynthesis protein TsaE
LRFRSPSPEVTRAAGRALAASLDPRGLVVGLAGPLGAGKTVFVKGLAEGLGIDPARVASPTFVIASEYPARGGRRLAHVDLYRVESPGELEAAGFLDLLEPGTLVAVEWADRFPEALPAQRLELRIERPDAAAAPSRRVLHAWASGEVAEAVLERWRRAVGALPELDLERDLE